MDGTNEQSDVAHAFIPLLSPCYYADDAGWQRTSDWPAMQSPASSGTPRPASGVFMHMQREHSRQAGRQTGKQDGEERASEREEEREEER